MIRNLPCYSEGRAQQDLLMEWTWGMGAREVKGELACFQPAHLREDWVPLSDGEDWGTSSLCGES